MGEARTLKGARKNENVSLYFSMLSLLRDWRSPLCERLEQAIVKKVCGYGLVQPRPLVPWALSLENGRGEKKGALIPVKKMTIF